ncbi:hypothetical protein, partial [Escherichia coli]
TSKTPSYTKSVSWQHHPIFGKKSKGIVYSDKNTGFFFPPELKSRSPDPLQPHRPNAVYLDLSTELSTHPALPKI